MGEAPSAPSEWERQLARLREENQSLRAQLEDAQETLRAIQDGAVDALVVNTPEGQQVFTLQGADQTYRHLLEQMHEGAATLSPDGVVHFCNQALADLLKLPLEQVIGTSVVRHVAAADQGAFETLMRQGLAGHAWGEFGLTAAEGGTVPMQIGFSPLSDGNAVASLSMIVFDLTDRKRAEQLLASEQFVRRLLDNAPIGIAVVGRDLRYLLANSAYQAIADVPVVGRAIGEVFPPAVAQIIQPLVQQVLGSGQAAEFRRYEAPVRGRTWWNVSEIPLLDAVGNTEAVLILTNEVTQQKLAEEALQESETQFRTLAESIPNLAWRADGDGFITWYNSRWYEYTGTTAEQMEGWGWQSVHDPNELPRVLQRWKASIATGEPFEMTFPLRGADGVFRPFLTRGVPLKDEEGRVVRWFGTNTDVSAQKQAEDVLRQTAQDLARSNEDLEQFAHVASHDLKEPLRMVTGFMSLLKDHCQGRLDAKAEKFISIAADAAVRMQGLIDDLLAYSRFGREKVRKPSDLDAILDRALNNLTISIQSSGAVITRDLLPTIRANPVELGQVFQNLIGNAIKFRGDRTPEIHIGVQRQEGRWLLTVRDNGVGIDPQFADRVFLIFQRLHTRRQYPGTGIGLAICKKIVDRHGGRIWVESQPGAGSTFCFTIADGEEG